jgi:phosphoglycolate phosphatase
MLKALICDLDGTLLDTVHSIAYYMNKTLSEFGIEPCRDEEYNYYAGDGARVLAKRTLASKGIYDENLALRVFERYKTVYDESPLYKTSVFNNVSEVLRALKEKGVKLAVVSNKPHSAAVPIVEHFFPGIFDLIRGQSEEFPLKPNKELGIFAAQALGLMPSETAYLGDTSVDIKFAKAYGAGLSVGVLWGFRDFKELSEAGAGKIISDARELLEVF